MADLVWYVSYGSNMHRDRLDCYLAGGRPAGALHDHPGCRDASAPLASHNTWLPGGIYFATYSPTWGGGRAFYDPTLPGKAAARGWLITASQFSDITAQENQREPGEDIDLGTVLSEGRHVLGSGLYETLLRTGDRDGYPVLTFTTDTTAAPAEPVAPSAAYLRMLAGGLRAAHGWTLQHTARYLAELPGAAGHWNPEELDAALRE